MSAVIPPVIIGGEIATKISNTISGSDSKTAGEVLTEKAIDSAGLNFSIGNPVFWKRAGIIFMGGMLIWWAVLLIIGSNDKVQAIALSAATKGAL